MKQETDLRLNLNKRRFTIGAEVTEHGANFRVWAPSHNEIAVYLEDINAQKINGLDLTKEQNGYFSGTMSEARVGSMYRFQIDKNNELLPDPASRFQPLGPFGPSEIIDPGEFDWTDQKWPGLELKGQVLYEMHIGTYTRQGNWESAMVHLPELAEDGITIIELMPVADFPGDYGWSYDGVNLFAPTRLYGRPNNMRRFVDTAHASGLGVILDVVYNHVGPVGNFFSKFSNSYFTDKYKTDWGNAINFDGPDSEQVREFVLSNAEYWISEYHLDGLRIDATQAIFDESPDHILKELTQRARKAAANKKILVIAENENQDTRLILHEDQGGYGLDAVWNDDFHHSMRVALTGQKRAYYTDYKGNAQEILSTIKRGYLYQGQMYKWQKKRRGTSTFGLEPSVFVNYIENHDQIANTLRGERIQFLTSPAKYRAVVALLMFAPGTPLLFQGQEFGASAHFVYFGNVSPELREKVHQGRVNFLSQFRNLANIDLEHILTKQSIPEAFSKCVIDQNERAGSRYHLLYRDLLHLRKNDPAFSAQRSGGLDGAVLDEHCLVLRYFSENVVDQRLLLINLGTDQYYSPSPEPLLAPPAGTLWDILWTSEDPGYGGEGIPLLDNEDGWFLPAESTTALKPVKDVRTAKSQNPDA